MVMDDTDTNGDYELYNEDNTVLSGLFSCLYAYTFGSCWYFKNADREEIELKPMTSSDQINDNGSNLGEGRGRERADCRMKKRIQYHFMDHIRRWMDPDQRRFPWKVILHLLLVVLVTTQVSLYAIDRSKITRFFIESNDAIKQYFKLADGDEEIALYNINDVYDQIERIVENYYSSSDQFVVLSSICYLKNKPKILNMSIVYLEIQECDCDKNLSNSFPDTRSSSVHRELFLATTTNDFDSLMNETACDDKSNCCTSHRCNHSIRDQVKYFINMDNLYRISQVNFNFTLSTTYQKGVIENYNAVDVEFRVDILLSSHDHLHSSRVYFDTKVEPRLKRSCEEPLRARNIIIDSIVIVLSVLASIGYFLSVIRSARLAKDAKLHFLAHHEKKLRWQELHILFNKFYILMLFTCVLLIIATVLKIIGEYEVLLITLKLAIPSILRFAVCMLILFLAFTFCGWLIIGPSNPQFENPLIAAETLIGIVNGDGIADAFAATSSDSVTNSTTLLIFSKLYLILFVFIFIYIVLSLFIGIFDHAYDSLSDNWRERSRGFLWDWAEGEPEDDLTKNYPFPVPRIRDLSGELRTECCKLHSYSAPLTKKKSRKATPTIESAKSYDPAPLPNATIESDGSDYTSSDENTRKGRKKLFHFSSDSKVLPPGHVKPPRHDHVRYSVRNPRRFRGTSRFISRRHKSFVKSIVEEPPDASQQEIAKAKLKLFHKGHHLEAELLQEDDM